MNRIVYLYDGTFNGLLTCVHLAYHSDSKPKSIVTDAQHIPTFFDEDIRVFTDQAKANQVEVGILNKLGEEVYDVVRLAHGAESETGGMDILRFLKVAFKMGPSCLDYRAHKHIGPVLDLYRKVTRESHRYVGLIRFMELDNGILYSQFESTYDVIEVLAGHFVKRLHGERWVLHDLKRGKAAICDGDTFMIDYVEIPEGLTLHEREASFQALWRTYFDHIAIKERINPKIQMNHMPKKYWKYLIERP